MHKNILKINLHLHTFWSDGWHSPKKLVKKAKKLGIGAIAVTDHNEIRGSLKATKLGKKYGVIVFPALELYFIAEGKFYELLGVFKDPASLKNFFNEFRFKNDFIPTFETIDEVNDLIKEHGGVTIAPHPYGRKGIYRDLEGRIIPDVNIETINAFTGRFRNRKAKKNCSEGLCHEFGAADLHVFTSALGHSYTQVTKKGGGEVSREELWDNIRCLEKTLSFTPKGQSYPPHMIMVQKILCGIKMLEYIPRQYIEFHLTKAIKRRERKGDQGFRHSKP